ncbi:hypothetical protein MP638_000617, partial [Amoeboaphelidium occidentale]
DSGAVVLYGLFMLFTGIVCGLFICVYLYRHGIISYYDHSGEDYGYYEGGGRDDDRKDSLFEFIRNEETETEPHVDALYHFATVDTEETTYLYFLGLDSRKQKTNEESTFR